jgi:hypothetical protein
VDGASGVVGANTVTFTVPYGTSLNSLSPTIAVSPGASISPASGTAQDFSSPQTYTVTAQDGSTKDYTVTGAVALNSAALITAFSIPGQSGSAAINNSANTITLTVPSGISLTSRAPSIAVSPGATINPASGVAQNFTSPVTYTVTAADSSTKTYTVSVSAAQNNSADIVSIAVNNWAFKPILSDDCILLWVAKGASLTGLIPTIVLSSPGATVSPASGVAHTFTNNYDLFTVTAANGTKKTFRVSGQVTQRNDPNPGEGIYSPKYADIMAVIPNTAYSEVWNVGDTWGIRLKNPGQSKTFAPTFIISQGATISPSSGTMRNFSTDQAYTVTSKNKQTSKTYWVHVED